MTSENKFSPQEAKEFKQLLKNRPELKKEYRHFKSESYQKLRGRAGGSPWLSPELDKAFKLAMISGI